MQRFLSLGHTFTEIVDIAIWNRVLYGLKLIESANVFIFKPIHLYITQNDIILTPYEYLLTLCPCLIILSQETLMT